jgi:DNA-binding NtrC family response regulator
MIASIKVLMVDDEERFLKTTKKILEYQGFKIILATSGQEAIAKLSENPDVVVLDIKMPGMDGHETLEKIKALVPDLPVIMLTGHGPRPSARKALSRGACEYLTKPCDMALLTSKIREAYQRIPKAETIPVSFPPSTDA